MPELSDPAPPPEPGEGNYLKARDLKNQPVILLPKGIKTNPKGREGPYEYVDCYVWVLDRSGVVQEADHVQVSWWRAMVQLRESIGSYVACRPTEQDDNSITLERLGGEAREVAMKVLAGLSTAGEPPDDGSEPF